MIEEALRDRSADIRPEFHEISSLAELEALLNGARFDVLHFMGHGEFVEGEGCLRIGDRLCGARHLAPIVAHSRQTGLVVLNSCRTAEVTRPGGGDPFAGVATALVQKALPAVVAMQFPVLDSAAALFAERFYSEIARGRSLEQAVEAARVRLWTEFEDPAICATPVVFQRTSGRVSVRAAPVEHPAEVPTLSAFMLDRLEVVKEVAAALDEQDAHGGIPLIAIAHGADEACFDALIPRLQRQDLPGILGIDESIRTCFFEWPDYYDDRTELWDTMTFCLAGEVTGGGRPDRDEILRCLAAQSAPPLVHTTLSAETWRNCGGRRTLDDSIAYWRDWPADRGRQRLLMLVGITYARQAEPRGLRRWFGTRRVSVDDEIASVLETIGGLRDDVLVVVLPKLGEIRYDDARLWAVRLQRLDLIPHIRQLFDDQERKTGSSTMSMDDASRALDELRTSGGLPARGAA
jgi:hypothetical protein